MDIFQDFLATEISYQDMYDEIMRFIVSFHIRSGEFEGNRFVIKKMDQFNFIIFTEDVYPNNRREISCAISIFRDNLVDNINKYASIKGIAIVKDTNRN